jgi:hypothetical protein
LFTFFFQRFFMKRLCLYGILTIALSFAFYACQDLSTNSSGTGSTTATVQATPATIMHPTYDVQLASYIAPTIENPASFNPGTLENLFPCPPPPPPPPGGGNKGGGPNGGNSNTMGGGDQGGHSRTFTPPPPPGGGHGGGPNGGNSNTMGGGDEGGHSRTFTPPPPPGGGGSRTFTPPPPPGGGGSHTFTPPTGGGSHTISIGNGKHPIELPFIPRNLNLTTDQVTIIQPYAKTYFDCIQAVMAADRPQMLQVVQDENASRKTILDSLAKGLINRKQAMADMVYVDGVARTKLQAISQDPALCVCLKAYLTSVRATLTPDQQVIWDAYVATLKGFCFGTTTTSPTH